MNRVLFFSWISYKHHFERKRFRKTLVSVENSGLKIKLRKLPNVFSVFKRPAPFMKLFHVNKTRIEYLEQEMMYIWKSSKGVMLSFFSN